MCETRPFHERLLRLHHGQRIALALCRRDREPRTAPPRAQAEACVRLHSKIQPQGGWRTLGERSVGAASFCLSKGAGVSEGSPHQSTGSILTNSASPLKEHPAPFPGKGTAPASLAASLREKVRQWYTPLAAFAQGKWRAVSVSHLPLVTALPGRRQ